MVGGFLGDFTGFQGILGDLNEPKECTVDCDCIVVVVVVIVVVGNYRCCTLFECKAQNYDA